MTTIQETINLVNAAREELGLEPLACLPRGHRGDPYNCPIARALEGEAYVGGHTLRYEEGSYCRAKAVAKAWEKEIIDEGDRYFIELPSEIAYFISRFDAGSYSHLAE